jgi:hypothetical protein
MAGRLAGNLSRQEQRKVKTNSPRILPAYFVRETEYVQPKQWIEEVMLIDVRQTTASIKIMKTLKDGDFDEDST